MPRPELGVWVQVEGYAVDIARMHTVTGNGRNGCQFLKAVFFAREHTQPR